MARPRLDQDKKLSRRLSIRLNNAEQAQLLKAAQICGIPLGTLVRERLLKGDFPKAQAARVDLASYAELKRIGVNLNQLTRLANAGIVSPRLKGLLEQLWQQQGHLLKTLLNDCQPKNR